MLPPRELKLKPPRLRLLARSRNAKPEKSPAKTLYGLGGLCIDIGIGNASFVYCAGTLGDCF